MPPSAHRRPPVAATPQPGQGRGAHPDLARGVEAYLRRGADDPSLVRWGRRRDRRSSAAPRRGGSQAPAGRPEQVDIRRQREGGRVVAEHNCTCFAFSPSGIGSRRRCGRADASAHGTPARLPGRPDVEAGTNVGGARSRAVAAGEHGSSSFAFRPAAMVHRSRAIESEAERRGGRSALRRARHPRRRRPTHASPGGDRVDVRPTSAPTTRRPEAGLGEEAHQKPPRLAERRDQAPELGLRRGRRFSVVLTSTPGPQAGRRCRRWVDAQQALLDRRGEERAHRGHDDANGRRREILIGEVAREGLQVALLDLRQSALADNGQDVQLEVALILGDGLRSDAAASAAS